MVKDPKNTWDVDGYNHWFAFGKLGIMDTQSGGWTRILVKIGVAGRSCRLVVAALSMGRKLK